MSSDGRDPDDGSPYPLAPGASAGVPPGRWLGRAARRALRPRRFRARDALARGVLRSAVFALESVAVAIVIGGGIGIVAQFAAADSIGGELWLPVLAIGVLAGLAALLALAVASVFVLQLRMSRDLEELRRAGGQPLPGRAAGDGEPHRVLHPQREVG